MGCGRCRRPALKSWALRKEAEATIQIHETHFQTLSMKRPSVPVQIQAQRDPCRGKSSCTVPLTAQNRHIEETRINKAIAFLKARLDILQVPASPESILDCPHGKGIMAPWIKIILIAGLNALEPSHLPSQSHVFSWPLVLRWEELLQLLPLLWLEVQGQMLEKRKIYYIRQILIKIEVQKDGTFKIEVLKVGTCKKRRRNRGNLTTMLRMREVQLVSPPAAERPSLVGLGQVGGRLDVAAQDGDVQQPGGRLLRHGQRKRHGAGGNLQEASDERHPGRLPCSFGRTQHSNSSGSIFVQRRIPILHPNAILHRETPAAMAACLPALAPARSAESMIPSSISGMWQWRWCSSKVHPFTPCDTKARAVSMWPNHRQRSKRWTSPHWDGTSSPKGSWVLAGCRVSGLKQCSTGRTIHKMLCPTRLNYKLESVETKLLEQAYSSIGIIIPSIKLLLIHLCGLGRFIEMKKTNTQAVAPVDPPTRPSPHGTLWLPARSGSQSAGTPAGQNPNSSLQDWWKVLLIKPMTALVSDQVIS